MLGTTVDRVLQEATCDVMMATFTEEGRPRDARRILVPTVAGPHTELALAVSGALSDVDYEIELLESDDVADAIVQETARHDLTVMGATREGLLQQMILGTIPESVAAEARSPVIKVKRYLGLVSWLKRWFRWQ